MVIARQDGALTVSKFGSTIEEGLVQIERYLELHS